MAVPGLVKVRLSNPPIGSSFQQSESEATKTMWSFRSRAEE
jgi:hypothetical protein